MSSLVRVWNDNTFPYEEEFRGKHIKIEPKSCVLMERDQAVLFKGTMPGTILLRNDGTIDPRSYKMIRIEQNSKLPEAKDEGHVLHATGQRFSTEDDMKAYVKANGLEDQLADDEARKAYVDDADTDRGLSTTQV